LAAAARVFADRGFAAASTDEIAAVAGFTKGAVYSNFASKDELFFALMDQQIPARVAEGRRLLRELPLTRDSAQIIGRYLAEGLTANRDWQLLFLDYWQRAMRDPDIRERFVAHRRQVQDLITSEVERYLDLAGVESKLPARSLMFALLGLSNGLALEELLDPGTVPPELVGQILTAVIEERPRRRRR
jgi:AcrR family transcriptional regulator